MRTGSELMLVYAVAYPAIGLGILSVSAVDSGLPAAFSVLAILVGASVALWQLHAAMRKRT
jgi:hypothetical protein